MIDVRSLSFIKSILIVKGSLQKLLRDYFCFAATLTLVLLSGSGANAQLGEKFDFYSGIRTLGMGDTGIAVVNDETALLINPAGLGKLRDFYGTILDPELELSYSSGGFYGTNPLTAPTTVEGVRGALATKPETYYYAKMQLFPSFVARNFGIGIHAKQYLAAKLNDDGTISAEQVDDMALVMGYNLRFFDGRVKLGMAGKVISRQQVSEVALDPALDLSNSELALTGQYREGLGLGVDAGLLLTAAWKYLPTLAVVARDLGGTRFDLQSGVRGPATDVRPLELKQDVDVALAMFPIHTNTVRSAWTVEYRNLLTNQDETNKNKFIHAGFEVNLADRFFLRAGYNQGYWTAGAESATENFQIQVATYGEEVGVGENTKEDRRYIGKVTFRF